MATPANKQSRTDIADSHYQNTFNKSSLREQERAATKEASQPEDIKSQEQSASSRQVSTTLQDSSDRKVPLVTRMKGKFRHKSAFAFVVIALAAGIWYSSILAPNIILVNIKDLFTNDLADATTALSKYTIKMIDLKLGKADCSDPETITCKLTTMSRNQVLEFKKHGFQINGQKIDEDYLDDNNPANDKPESRWKVTSITFPNGGGTATDGASYVRIASSSDTMRHIANSVWNPRSSFFMDARYKQRIKTQFDLTKNATVYGRTEKDVDKSFDESMQGENELIDKAGQGAYSLRTLASQKGQSALYKTAMDIAEMPNSYINTQCALWTQGKITYNAAKRAKEVTVARFAMQYLKAADQIKAGLSDEITTNVLSGKLAWSSDGGFNGKNATDASMYRHIVLREPVTKSQNGRKYYADAFDVIGALFPVSSQLTMTATATKGIANTPGNLSAPPADLSSDPRAYCLYGQTTDSKSAMKPTFCPALTMAAAAAPSLVSLSAALAPVAALSDRTCPQPPKGIWQMYPTAHATALAVMPLVAGLFNSALSQWAEKIDRDFTSDTKGTAASDAIFAGTGIILGDMAMSRGMKPAGADDLQEYLALKAESDREYEQVARFEARKSPFDVYNSYSFVGSLVRSFSTTTANNTILDTVNTTLDLLPASIAKTTSTAGAVYNLQPAPLDTARLQCADAEYLQIGINADMGCNVRYSMGKTELNADVKKVLTYMLTSHPDESQDHIKDLTDRLNKTDAERDKGEVSRQLSEVEAASKKPFINAKTGKATENSEYEKYLTYCVNRLDPWGRTGLDVRKKDLSDEEKEKRRLSKDPDGNQITSTNLGDEYERVQTAMYMSITEGSVQDQDWRTGKKCLEDSEMLQNFRAFTMACSVDGSFAGAIDCTEKDRAGAYTDDFYTSNDIQYLSWY